MYTRKDRLDNKCSHEEYYHQFVTGEHKQYVRYKFGINKLKIAYEENKSFNTISLSQWDWISISPFMMLKISMKDVGDYLTMSGIVCILKQAAREIVLENK
jgi:hypothetical protein